MKRALTSPDNTSISTPKKSGRISELKDGELDESFSPHPSIYVLASQTPLNDDSLNESIDSTAEVINKMSQDETLNSLSQTPLTNGNLPEDPLNNNSETYQSRTPEDPNSANPPKGSPSDPFSEVINPDDPNSIKTDMLSIIIKYVCDIKQELRTALESNEEIKQEMRTMKEEFNTMSEDNKAILAQLHTMNVENRALKRQLITKCRNGNSEEIMEVGDTEESDEEEIVPESQKKKKAPTIQVNRQRPKPQTTNIIPPVTSTNNKARKTDNRLTLKSKIEKEWGKTFHQRRVQYKRDFLNTEKAKILEEDLKRGFLRRKYRPNPANSERHHKILEKKSVEMIKSDIEELRMYAQEARENYIRCDEQIEELVNYTFKNEDERYTLMSLWEDEVLKSQPISRNMCQRNILFLRNLHNTDPYKGYVPNQTRDFRRGQRQY